MKVNIHPKYDKLVATCSCGNKIETNSCHTGTMQLDICSACHPFFTGQQKNIDSAGRIDKFNKRFGSLGKRKA